MENGDDKVCNTHNESMYFFFYNNDDHILQTNNQTLKQKNGIYI